MFGSPANSNRQVTGKLAENIMHFARVLREAGIPVGPGSVLDALDAAMAGPLQDLTTRFPHLTIHITWNDAGGAQRFLSFANGERLFPR